MPKPFAERLAIKIAKKNTIGEISFYSVGLEVLNPSPPPKEGILGAENFGVHFADHKARIISHNMLDSFDINIFRGDSTPQVLEIILSSISA